MAHKPEFAVEEWPVDKVVPYTRNARKIPESAITKVARSIKEFGWQQPIVVDGEGVILAGHTRLLAAKKLGLKAVPVKVEPRLTPGQANAFRLMDNRSHEEAQWDYSMLSVELEDLREIDFDLELTGFDQDQLKLFLHSHWEPEMTPQYEEPKAFSFTLRLSGDQHDTLKRAMQRLKINDECEAIVEMSERLMKGELV